MAFSGWSPEAVEFFQDLRADNTKAYWSAHKGFYATLDRGGYVRFGADGLTAALGYYMMTTAQLERYRQAVIDDAPGARAG
jgi:uncharacterized protein (DUF2461 family)